jgi:hypothetical protein
VPIRSKWNSRRAVLVWLACVLAWTALPVALTAGAGNALTTSTTVPALPPELLTGISVVGAVVNSPGAKPRTLDANQATAFMQTWVAYSVFQNPPNERPPSSLPVSRLSVATDSQGTLLIFYASDGTNAWVGAPNADAAAKPPNNEKWIRAPEPQRTIAGFEGRLAPTRTPLPLPTTTTTAPGTTAAPSTTKATKSSDNGGLWALVALGAAVIVAASAILAVRGRRRTQPQS